MKEETGEEKNALSHIHINFLGLNENHNQINVETILSFLFDIYNSSFGVGNNICTFWLNLEH